jgi:DNA-binding response OmpR family regulator
VGKERVSAQVQNKQRKVLIVDDDERIRSLLSDICTSEGYMCDVADSGERALACLHAHEYQLMLLDAAMPGGDGYEVLRHARGLANGASVPVIMVTANAREDGKELAFSLGVYAYLEKPFRIFELTQKMRLAMRTKRSPSQPPTLSRIRVQRSLAGVLQNLPPVHELRPLLRQTLEQVGLQSIACLIVRLDNGRIILNHLGHEAHDATMGAMAVQAKGLADGDIFQSDEDELCFLSTADVAGRIGEMLHHMEDGAQIVLREDSEFIPEISIGVSLVHVESDHHHENADNVLRHARALASQARASKTKFCLQWFSG